MRVCREKPDTGRYAHNSQIQNLLASRFKRQHEVGFIFLNRKLTKPVFALLNNIAVSEAK